VLLKLGDLSPVRDLEEADMMLDLKTEAEKSYNGNGTAHRLGVDALGDDFWGLPQLPPLATEGKRKTFSAKEVISREGDPVTRLYLIRSGLVKLLSYLPNGRARIVRLHSRDHWIGLEGLLGQSYTHTAIAIDKVAVEHCSIYSLQRFQQENPGALRQLLCQWHGDLAQADKWILDFSTGEIKCRVARLLRFLAELENGQASNQVELLKVHEMADILGVTQESVSRVLAGFKRSRILHKQGDPLREIYQLDTEKLRREE